MIDPINTEEQWEAFRDYVCQHSKEVYEAEPLQYVNALGEYLSIHKIKDVVLGVSGGVDSACVLAMLSHIKQNTIHDLEIHARCIMFNDAYPNFNTRHVYDLIDAYDDHIDWQFISAQDECNELMHQMFHNTSSDRVAAQFSYALRYTMLFAVAQNYNGVTIGTTNKDEFEYSGWFGKNSDMVVDIQPIIRCNKRTVKMMATYLGVPSSIVDREPVGDLIDGSSDEENFGCSYDDLTAFTALAKTDKSTQFLQERFAKLIALHKRNYHKYLGQGYNPVFL